MLLYARSKKKFDVVAHFNLCVRCRATLPMPKTIAIIVATFAGLLLAGWITSAFFAPITFR